jgi:L-threonylcarbamoyladenylate synthase
MTDKSRIIAANAQGIAEAAAILNAGGIVAVPTETVYGLAARASDAVAVARIYEAKGRPSFNPLIVHVADAASASALVEVSPLAATLMAAFWPGPLTLVLPKSADADVAGLVTAGLETLAVRCPAHPVMQALIAACGPLAAPSANASGRISSTTAAHVAATLEGRVPLILDGGACAAGVESTIVAVTDAGWRLLRPGAVSREDLAAVAGDPAPLPSRERSDSRSEPGEGDIIAPGMLESHYAPRQPVRLAALTASADEFHIGFGAIAGDASLSCTGDLVEAAARLFDLLHRAEASGRAAIAVAPVPETGLGLAINDRLRRAAAPRG